MHLSQQKPAICHYGNFKRLLHFFVYYLLICCLTAHPGLLNLTCTFARMQAMYHCLCGVVTPTSSFSHIKSLILSMSLFATSELCLTALKWQWNKHLHAWELLWSKSSNSLEFALINRLRCTWWPALILPENLLSLALIDRESNLIYTSVSHYLDWFNLLAMPAPTSVCLQMAPPLVHILSDVSAADENGHTRKVVVPTTVLLQGWGKGNMKRSLFCICYLNNSTNLSACTYSRVIKSLPPE